VVGDGHEAFEVVLFHQQENVRPGCIVGFQGERAQGQPGGSAGQGKAVL